MKIVQKIQLKIVIFTAVKNRCMLHERVCVMIYYNLEAIFIPFLLIFEDDESGNFLKGNKSFRTLKRIKMRQKTTRQMT